MDFSSLFYKGNSACMVSGTQLEKIPEETMVFWDGEVAIMLNKITLQAHHSPHQRMRPKEPFSDG